MYPHRKFHLRGRKHLWDSGSEEEEESNKLPLTTRMDMIDLSCSPPELISSTDTSVLSTTLPVEQLPSTSALSTQQEQEINCGYIPRTWQYDSRRYLILPAFPTSFYNDRPPLLLANVPVHKLNQAQLARRRPGVYPLGYSIEKKNFDIPSYFVNTYQPFISSLIYQYNVDEPILDYNLYRFTECFRLLTEDFIQHHKYHPLRFELNEKQKKYAFEFYLQIDVDLFFMKTCSYRKATPRSFDEGLFCQDEPESRYGFLPCNNCSLCLPSQETSNREQQQSTIRFSPNHKFRFVNGYQTILNCPADCQTANIIYTMICPCGEFEYIGETSQRLGDRLWYHRQHFNRIIDEFLIGDRNVKLTRMEEKDAETLRKDRMLLYKHACRCPWAIQRFLDFNPIYWCFVPMTIEEIEQNGNYIVPPSLVLLDSINPTSIASKDRQVIPETRDKRSDEATRSCMRALPPMPSGYTYSIRQRIEQFQYFKNKLDIKAKPTESIELFNATIIAVLPIDASDAVRKFVESLFITHTEAKLNIFGRLLNLGEDDEYENSNHPMSSEAQRLDRGEWCRNLFRRPSSTSILR